MLFSSTVHCILCIIAFISSCCLYSLFNIYGNIIQSIASRCIYAIFVILLFILEYLIRYEFNIKEKEEVVRAGIKLSKSEFIYRIIVKMKNKRLLIGIVFYFIAVIAYLFQMFTNDTCVGYIFYNFSTSIALTFWYWSVYGEQWSFKLNVNKKNMKRVSAQVPKQQIELCQIAENETFSTPIDNQPTLRISVNQQSSDTTPIPIINGDDEESVTLGGKGNTKRMLGELLRMDSPPSLIDDDHSVAKLNLTPAFTLSIPSRMSVSQEAALISVSDEIEISFSSVRL